MSPPANAPPNATLKLEPFTIKIEDEVINDFKTLLKLSPLSPPTWDGKHREFGVTSEWMSTAKSEWEKFDW